MENQHAPRIEHLKKRILGIIKRTSLLLKMREKANDKEAEKIYRIIWISIFRLMFLKKDLEREIAPTFPSGGIFSSQNNAPFSGESIMSKIPKDWTKIFREELDVGKIDLSKMSNEQKLEFGSDLAGKAILNDNKIDLDNLRYAINNFSKK